MKGQTKGYKNRGFTDHNLDNLYADTKSMWQSFTIVGIWKIFKVK